METTNKFKNKPMIKWYPQINIFNTHLNHNFIHNSIHKIIINNNKIHKITNNKIFNNCLRTTITNHLNKKTIEQVNWETVSRIHNKHRKDHFYHNNKMQHIYLRIRSTRCIETKRWPHKNYHQTSKIPHRCKTNNLHNTYQEMKQIVTIQCQMKNQQGMTKDKENRFRMEFLRLTNQLGIKISNNLHSNHSKNKIIFQKLKLSHNKSCLIFRIPEVLNRFLQLIWNHLFLPLQDHIKFRRNLVKNWKV